MSGASASWGPRGGPLRTLFESGRFANAISLAIVGTAFSSYALRQLMGWGGLLGALGALTVLAIGSFIAHRDAIEWHGLLPISLLVFLFWSTASTVWSQYQWVTLGSVAYQWIFAFLGVYLALVRDTIQVVRVVGDVLRFLLTLSLALEVLSGILIDAPIRLLGIQGTIASLGPIQGIFGSRNALGLVALIAVVTFFVERRTRSVPGYLTAWSLPLAAVSALLSRSPVVAVVFVIVLFGMGALQLLRLARNERTRFGWQIALALFVVGASAVSWAARDRIIGLLSARSVLQARLPLWQEMWSLSKVYPLDGWGWTGLWRPDLPPYAISESVTGVEHANGLNAYLDILLQLGIVGAIVFGILVSLALGRSWLVASNRRSVIHTWPPLVLIALLATSVVESSVLVDYGWLLLVICTVKASQGMSWRSALPHRHEVLPPTLPPTGPIRAIR